MSGEVVVPSIVVAAAALLAMGCHRRVPPAVAARLLLATIVVGVLAVVPVALIVALSFVAHLPLFGGALAWCNDALGLHPDVPRWLGLIAVAFVTVGLVRASSVRRGWRRFHHERSHGVQVVESDELYAYTMPGPGGQIIVSTALVDQLDRKELAIVVNHERAHARFRHDRYVHVSELAVALLPPLRLLQRRLRFSLERWADEAAVAASCCERAAVARTVATVALSQAPTPIVATAVAGLGVAGRVEALLHPPRLHRARLWTLLNVTGIAAVTIVGVAQSHHLLPLIRSLCPG